MVAAPQMGDRVRKLLFVVILLLAARIHARADTYFVTVAGLGGEADYQTRFNAEATDLDKIFKASGAGVHVFTLSGADATRAKLLAALQQVASAAKPMDDFVMVMIDRSSQW